MTYYVEYWVATPNRRLLGGVTRSRSSRFSHWEDAKARLQSVISTHMHLDSPIKVEGRVMESTGHAEIVRHCKTAQALDCRCPECGVWIRREK
jgi:hypothetical protein